MNFPGKLREFIPAAQLIIIDGNYVQETKFSEDGKTIFLITPDKIEYAVDSEESVINGTVVAHIPGVSDKEPVPIQLHKLQPVESRQYTLGELVAVADYVHVNAIDAVKVTQIPDSNMLSIVFHDGPPMKANAYQSVTLIEGECDFRGEIEGEGKMETHRMSFFLAFKMTADLYDRRIKSM